MVPALRAAFAAEGIGERELFAKILEGVASGLCIGAKHPGSRHAGDRLEFLP